MHSLLQDIRYGLRMLRRSPGFAAIVVLILALGIGANTAIFSVVNALLLRPLPLVQPEALVVCVSTRPEQNTTRGTITYPDYLDWKTESDVFRAVALYTDPPLDLSGDGIPERVQAAAVTEDFFTVLSAPPLLGRGFLPEDHQPGSGQVVVLSQGLWQRRFGGDPDIIGKTVRLGGDPHVVVGVMPSTAQWPPSARLWVPLTYGSTPPADVMRRDNFAWRAIARLNTGVSLPEARARVAAIANTIADEYPDIRAGSGANLLSLSEFMVAPNVSRSLWVLMCSVAAVLLIVCSNVANLMIARSADRSREMAVRAALGAGRFQLIRLLLVEGMLLALFAGVLGVVLAVWGTDLLRTLVPDSIPRLGEVGLDRRVAVFALALSLLTGVLFALLPALHASRPDLHRSFKEVYQGRATTPGRHRLRSGLVVTQIAVSLVLLVGAGLMTRSFVQVLRAEPGFQTGNLLTFQLSLPEEREPGQSAQAAEFYDQALERLRAIPAVTSVAAASVLPLAGGDYTHRAFVVEGAPPPPDGSEYIAAWNAVTHDYFNTLGIPLLKGRVFTDMDREQGAPVIIINEALARQMFPDEDPIGKRIWRWRIGGDAREVVGVVRNASFFNVTDQDRALVYVPHRQDARRSMVLAMRTTGDPLLLVDAARDAIASIDKDLAMAQVTTMDQASDAFFARLRFIALLVTGFALVALLLALAGIYGVVSYSVSQRRHEFGVRMTLGAQGRDVLGQVMKQGLALTLTGVTAGILASLAVTQTLRSLLYGVSATDPATLASVAMTLSLAALAACYFPARRAANVDPMVALRCE